MHRSLIDVTNRSRSNWPDRPTYAIRSNISDFNSILKRYLAEHVPVNREKRDLVSNEVIPYVKDLLTEINAQDDRFAKEIVRSGSSTQGLSVKTKGDYDFSVVFKLDPREAADSPSKLLIWSDQHTPMQYAMYGFEDSEENETSSLRKDLKIVRKETSLPNPGFGYSQIRLHWPHSDFDDSDFEDDSDSNNSSFDDSNFESLQFDGDLIPHLVKFRFKSLLQNALEKLGLKDVLKLSRDAHGPALTLQTEVTTTDGKRHSVSIDLAIIIRARLEFIPEMGWPPVRETSRRHLPIMSLRVPKTTWPASDKVEAIQEKGINLVAKKPFFWYVSYSELEKKLVEKIDEDGGCRKDVHRIMKSVFYNVCKEKPVLSSYILKNVWFLECEKYPKPESWQLENMAERYYRCLLSLREYGQQGKLPQYFNRSVNLLKDKDVRADVEKITLFDFGKVVSQKREAENVADFQPHPKMARGDPTPLPFSWGYDF